MSKPSKIQQAVMVARAAADPAIDRATRADLDAALVAAERGQSLTPAVTRALSAARSRTWEAVADAGLAAGADPSSRTLRSRVKQAVAGASAVRSLELRLAGGEPDVQNGAPTGAVADAETETPATSPADAELHAAENTAEGADLHTATDQAEVYL